MENHKLIIGLCYISIIFAPFLFPLLVWLFSGEPEIKYHSSKALKLHLLPVLVTIAVFVVGGLTGVFSGDAWTTSLIFIILMIFAVLLDFVLVIYNLVVGIKILLG